MSQPKRGESIDVGALLTIDVESELRKLTQAQLQGSWQLPAELVRQAIRQGARTLEVELGRLQLHVKSVGGGIPYDTLREVGALLDPRREPERRHRALIQLEREGGLALLGLIGLEPSGLRIISAATRPGEPGWGLQWQRGGEVQLQRFEPAPTHTEVVVRGPKLDRARARAWLTEAARFVGVLEPVEIRVDGRLLPQGFEDAIARARIVVPMPGALALPRTGEVARVILLQDGIITAHVSLTDAPCFEVALETRGLAEPGASAARLRELITPQLDRLVDVAVEHMIELGREGASLTTGDRSRLSQQLLQAARRRPEQAKIIARLPLFRGLERDGRERWYDLLALRQTVHEEGGERLLTALFPDQDLGDFAPEGRVYLLDEAERALLGELLQLGFRQPRRRVGRHRGLGELLRQGVGVRVRDLFAVLRPGGRAIPDAELDPDERNLLVQLRAQLEHCEVAMCTGDGAVRRRGPGADKLLLPRGSATVRAAVRSVALDPGWVYPALLALLAGRDFPDRARRRWRLDSWRSVALVALIEMLGLGSCSNRSSEPPAPASAPAPEPPPAPAPAPAPEPEPEPELAQILPEPEPEPPPDPFPGRSEVSVGELLAALSEQVVVLAESPEVQRDYQQFLIDWRVPDDPEIYLDYVRVRLAFEATRAGGLWGMSWKITNELPRSDLVWAQWRKLELSDDAELPETTAVAECDELSALFAFVVHRIGLSKRSEVGLLWPTSDHTVAVWTLDRKSEHPIRIVVPTSQIYLGKTQSLGTGEFNPWRQKSIFDYRRKDAALKFELPAPLARRFVRAVQDHGGRSQAELQTLRNEREKRQWALR